MTPISQISIISTVLNLFRVFRSKYTQNILVSITYINPNAEAHRPAIYIEFGVDINDTPTYNLQSFATVGNGPDVLIFLDFLVKCLSEKFEFVNLTHLSLGF